MPLVASRAGLPAALRRAALLPGQRDAAAAGRASTSCTADALGLLGSFLQLLRHVPQESAWSWLLASCEERALQQAPLKWTYRTSITDLGDLWP